MARCSKLDSLESAQLEELSEYLRAISDFNRLQILHLLSGGERCVCDIYKELNLPQNLVSHHLKVLKEAGVVKARRDGTWIKYKFNKKSVSRYNDVLGKVLKRDKS